MTYSFCLHFKDFQVSDWACTNSLLSSSSLPLCLLAPTSTTSVLLSTRRWANVFWIRVRSISSRLAETGAEPRISSIRHLSKIQFLFNFKRNCNFLSKAKNKHLGRRDQPPMQSIDAVSCVKSKTAKLSKYSNVQISQPLKVKRKFVRMRQRSLTFS